MVWLIYTAPIKYIIQGIIEILLSMTGFMITSFKATNLGIVSGTDENKFEPNNTITLAQLFRMMFESAKS